MPAQRHAGVRAEAYKAQLRNATDTGGSDKLNAVHARHWSESFARFQEQSASLYSTDSQVKQLLDGEGVATIQYPFYLCFGRELHSLISRGHSGESFAQEVACLVAKWVGRGLTQSVLESIRSQVFNIGAPTP